MVFLHTGNCLTSPLLFIISLIIPPVYYDHCACFQTSSYCNIPVRVHMLLQSLTRVSLISDQSVGIQFQLALQLYDAHSLSELLSAVFEFLVQPRLLEVDLALRHFFNLPPSPPPSFKIFVVTISWLMIHSFTVLFAQCYRFYCNEMCYLPTPRSAVGIALHW